MDGNIFFLALIFYRYFDLLVKKLFATSKTNSGDIFASIKLLTNIIWLKTKITAENNILLFMWQSIAPDQLQLRLLPLISQFELIKIVRGKPGGAHSGYFTG